MEQWYYAVEKVESAYEEGAFEYRLVEVYPLGEGKQGIGDNVTFQCESPGEVAHWLRVAADDVEKYGEVKLDG